MDNPDILPILERIAASLERLSPTAKGDFAAEKAKAFLWEADSLSLKAVKKINAVPLKLLLGVDRQKELILDNTRQFAEGYAANNALLWGARGTGKSSLVKAVHWDVARKHPIKLIEIHRDDIAGLPILLNILKSASLPCIVFCDDLSFEAEDLAYKSLKAVLEGGIEGRPDNVIFYATSNRRHMMSRQMIENEKSTAINPYEAVEEKVSLSDRFGLWIGFHACSQDMYLAMIEAYVKHYKLSVRRTDWQAAAIEWTVTRGARSGRVAWQFVQDLAGRHRIALRR